MAKSAAPLSPTPRETSSGLRPPRLAVNPRDAARGAMPSMPAQKTSDVANVRSARRSLETQTQRVSRHPRRRARRFVMRRADCEIEGCRRQEIRSLTQRMRCISPSRRPSVIEQH